MTVYQKKNLTIGKDPQVTQMLELSLMGFKNNYIQENEGENKEIRWGENGELHHKIELYKISIK